MQLVIISGKGGTGKTTISASFIYLNNNSINIDCDVDASNLHLLFSGDIIEEKQFSGAKIASIDKDICNQCGLCESVCRFQAIKEYTIQPLKCEGCSACQVVCPQDAIKLEDEVTATTIIQKTNKGYLSTAEMEVGAEGSGKLVTQVRKSAKKYYNDEDLIILDGTPGVGCAVMASITGCDRVLIVVEPTLSGLEDFLRVYQLTKHFKLESYVCINKFDINNEMTQKIEEHCKKEGINIIGKIPFDPYVNKSVNNKRPVVTYKESKAGIEIIKMWENIKKIIGG